MHKVKIKFKAFPYFTESVGIKPDGTQGKVAVEKLARRDDEIEVNDFDYEKGVRLGAFYDGDEPEPEVAEREIDVASADVDELAEWIEEDSVSVKDLVAAAGDDRQVAQKLLDAETQATGGQPRKTAVSGLEAIIEAD
jgi:hypothetical protein